MSGSRTKGRNITNDTRGGGEIGFNMSTSSTRGSTGGAIDDKSKKSTTTPSTVAQAILPTREHGGGTGGGMHSKNEKSCGSSVDEPVTCLHTEEWPFGCEQPDVENEALLGRDPSILTGRTDVPLLNAMSFKQVHLPAIGATARELEKWDLECAGKHLDAIKASALSHDELQDILLTDGEDVIDMIDLVGIANAPGLLTDVTQQCRRAFTNKNRIVFTQTSHSAEVGVPQLGCLFSLIECCHDRWSTRKWTAFYASINTSEVLHVFVQQTLTTSYQATNCGNCKLSCASLCCAVGGTFKSQKSLHGVTQTLADHDQASECVQKWNKTRFMRHSLVIRYVDHANNRVEQVVAMAHPGIPSARLYQLAKMIDAARTLTTKDWLDAKLIPTPGGFGPFSNEPAIPLLKRGWYRGTLLLLLIVALGLLAMSVVGGVLMIIGVLVMLSGSYTQLAQTSAKIFNMRVSMGLTYLTTGGAVVYALGLLIAIAS